MENGKKGYPTEAIRSTYLVGDALYSSLDRARSQDGTGILSVYGFVERVCGIVDALYIVDE